MDELDLLIQGLEQVGGNAPAVPSFNDKVDKSLTRAQRQARKEANVSKESLNSSQSSASAAPGPVSNLMQSAARRSRTGRSRSSSTASGRFNEIKTDSEPVSRGSYEDVFVNISHARMSSSRYLPTTNQIPTLKTRYRNHTILYSMD
jgi:hypothetical protein